MKTLSFSHIGKRTNQEDAFGYDGNIFMVCDGIGGHTKGEIASNFIKDFILENPIEINKLNIEKLLIDAQKTLNEKYGQNPETTGMGTTFCGLFFNKNNAFIAYIGDSRLYWLKPNKNLIWHTWDHSIVGELVKSGEITREEGRHHPMNNRISKAIVANKENKTTNPDIYKIDNIDNNDIFFLCTDGVNEAWSDHDLVNVLLSKEKNIEHKLNIIQSKCESDSNDNNTAIVIEIEENEKINNGNNQELEWIPVHEIMNQIDSSKRFDLVSNEKNVKVKFIQKSFRLLFLIVLIAVFYFIWNKK